MGRIDKEARNYMKDTARFADAFNYMLYKGEQVINPEDLTPVDTSELVLPYKDETRTQVQRIRDLAFCWQMMTDRDAVYVILGGELQAAVHYAMPVRNMLYDAMNYSAQVTEQARINAKDKTLDVSKEEFLSGFREEDRLKPVITLVIYLGENEWKGPTRLHKMLNTDNPDLLKYVQDYELLLIDPHKIPDAEMEKFQTDFGQMMICTKYAKDKEKLEEVVRSSDKFRAMRKDFISLFNLIARTRFTYQDKEEETDMWKAFEDMQNEAMEKGKELTMLEAINNIMISFKVSIQQAMDVMKIPEEDRAKYMRKL